jgi:hypothetical protein
MNLAGERLLWKIYLMTYKKNLLAYLTYKDNKKLAPLVREIGWSHNLLIFEKCKDDLEREFYIKLTKKYGWTKNILIHQIESGSFEQFVLNQTNFTKALEEKYRHQAYSGYFINTMIRPFSNSRVKQSPVASFRVPRHQLVSLRSCSG